MTDDELKLKAPRGEYLIELGIERDIVDSINMATKIQRTGKCMGNSWEDIDELVCNGRQKEKGGGVIKARDVIALRHHTVGFISVCQSCVIGLGNSDIGPHPEESAFPSSQYRLRSLRIDLRSNQVARERGRGQSSRHRRIRARGAGRKHNIKMGTRDTHGTTGMS